MVSQRNYFTPEQDTFLMEHHSRMKRTELAKALEECFGVTASTQRVKNRCKKLGLKKKNVYTEEQKTFLRENSPRMNREKLAESFNAAFGTCMNVLALNRYCELNGWMADRELSFYRFKQEDPGSIRLSRG